MWFRRKRPIEPQEPFRGLRAQILGADPSEIGLSPTSELPHVWGVLIETGYPEAVATLVVLADGTTSMYFSNGGGILGAGAHASVRAAGAQLLAVAEQYLATLEKTAATPLPAVGQVRFYVQTFDGTLTAEAKAQDLGARRHALSGLFLAGHAVIAAVRQSTPPVES